MISVYAEKNRLTIRGSQAGGRGAGSDFPIYNVAILPSCHLAIYDLEIFLFQICEIPARHICEHFVLTVEAIGILMEYREIERCQNGKMARWPDGKMVKWQNYNDSMLVENTKQFLLTIHNSFRSTSNFGI